MNRHKHCDAGLMNINHSSHVNAALQALLHVPEFVKVIEEDEDHRHKCRSLLKCMSCLLYRLIASMKQVGMGNPSSLVLMWNGLSSLLETQQSKADPFYVFQRFTGRLLLDFLERNPEYTVQDCQSSPVGKCFVGVKHSTVHCKLCGKRSMAESILPFEIISEVSQEAIINSILLESKRQCTFCGRFEKSTCDSVALPQYLVVKSTVACSSSFHLPMILNIFSQKCQFYSCMVESEESSSFISLCPDGSVRQFKDEKISKLSIGKLATSDILSNSKLTVIYKKDDLLIRKTSHAPRDVPIMTEAMKQQTTTTYKQHRPPVTTQRTTGPIITLSMKQPYKVISMPKLDNDLYSDLPESPRTRTISTQTEKANMVDSCSQTDIDTRKHKPMVSYDECRYHAKFEFFTGLNSLDFEAFHEFIGGENTINTLKMKYSLSTPKKKTKSDISSRDKLFMFLLRFRRGLPLEELAFIFDYSVPHVSEICYVMTRLIYDTFKAMEDKVFISAAKQAKMMPLVMKPFKNLRVILDGASFFIETPSNFQMQGNTFSAYKSHNVLLFEIGVSCHGSTIFCSKGFEGNMSDKGAVLNSPELLEKLQRGDAVMVDRGFEITSEFLKMGVHVIVPPNKYSTLNASEEIFTKAVAAARIYVEHAIADIKDNRILQGIAPLTLLPVFPQLVYIGAFMRNFSTKKIKNKVMRVSI